MHAGIRIARPQTSRVLDGRREAPADRTVRMRDRTAFVRKREE
jgi:hypothetical protein